MPTATSLQSVLISPYVLIYIRATMRERQIVRVPSLVVVAAALLLLCGLLSACSSAGMGPFTVFADPGEYQYHSCKQLVGPRRRAVKREQELRLLMDKAEKSTGGALVNVIAYKADYVTAQEELKVIEATARAKNCDPNWPEPSERDEDSCLTSDVLCPANQHRQ
jgi:hypothetical protein